MPQSGKQDPSDRYDARNPGVKPYRGATDSELEEEERQRRSADAARARRPAWREHLTRKSRLAGAGVAGSTRTYPPNPADPLQSPDDLVNGIRDVERVMNVQKREGAPPDVNRAVRPYEYDQLKRRPR